MRDDPKEIPARLVHEHGMEEARGLTPTRVLHAQEQRDNYALSIWRQVKWCLSTEAEFGNGTAA